MLAYLELQYPHQVSGREFNVAAANILPSREQSQCQRIVHEQANDAQTHIDPMEALPALNLWVGIQRDFAKLG